MKAKLIVICVTCLLFLALSAFAAEASMVLSEEEMGALLGGCPGRCGNKTCGSDVACKAIPDTQKCTPDPDYSCNNTKKIREVRLDCGGYLWPKPLCTKGPLTGCGPWHQCQCDDYDPGAGYGTCNYNQTVVVHWPDDFRPCKDP